MSRKRFKPEQIIKLLREAEMGLSQGRRIGEVCRSLGISQQSYYRWRSECGGMKLEQVKRGRLWLADGSCIRLRPSWPNHVWSYDFVQDRTHEGRTFRMGSSREAAVAVVSVSCSACDGRLGRRGCESSKGS
jgi:hypothetical protein